MVIPGGSHVFMALRIRQTKKIRLLHELRDVRGQCTGPWLVAEVFNFIYKDEDKNNNNLNRAMMGKFRRWINDLALSKIPLLGR